MGSSMDCYSHDAWMSVTIIHHRRKGSGDEMATTYLLLLSSSGADWVARLCVHLFLAILSPQTS